MTSLYDTLGVEPDATPDQIKQAYRRAAMRWHPDRNEANRKDAEARFKTVAMAYAVLSDSIKRRQYDAEVSADRAAEAEAAKAAEADVVDSVETFVDALFSMARVTWNDLSQSDARAMFTEILIRRGCPPEMTVKLMASLLDESGNFNLTPPQTPPLRRSSPQPQYPRASAVVRPLPRGFRRSVALGFLLAAAAFGVLLASMLGKL